MRGVDGGHGNLLGLLEDLARSPRLHVPVTELEDARRCVAGQATLQLGERLERRRDDLRSRRQEAQQLLAPVVPIRLNLLLLS